MCSLHTVSLLLCHIKNYNIMKICRKIVSPEKHMVQLSRVQTSVGLSPEPL